MKTEDGYDLENGEIIWEVTYCKPTGMCIPQKSVFTTIKVTPQPGSYLVLQGAYYNYSACREACDKLNRT